MSNDHKKGPGGHYSGANPIPNIQRFVASLDADKKERDAKISEELKNKNSTTDAVEHKNNGQPHGVAGTTKTVTDPTTGRQVQIEDVSAEFMKTVDNPQVSFILAKIVNQITFQLIFFPCRYSALVPSSQSSTQ